MIGPSITGDKELDKRLKEISAKVERKIVRSAVTKALRVLAKSIKAQVPPKYKDAKKAIGVAFRKDKGGANRGLLQAKVGAAVGISKERRDIQTAKQQALRTAKKKRGVGISARNIHWAVLGTGPRQKKSGQKTGSMRPILQDIVQTGFAAGESQATATLIESLRTGIDKENHK